MGRIINIPVLKGATQAPKQDSYMEEGSATAPKLDAPPSLFDECSGPQRAE